MRTWKDSKKTKNRFEPVTISYEVWGGHKYYRIDINDYCEYYSIKEYKEMKRIYFKAYYHLNK